MWCSGRTLSTPSPTRRSKSPASFAASEAKFRCVSSTPLGLPVVPLVKSTEATSSAAALLRRAGSPAASEGRSASGKLIVRSPGNTPNRSATRGLAISTCAFAACAQFCTSAGLRPESSGAAVAPALRMPK